ncbi:MAG: SprT family zinc-dependent metalloprotease [Vicinamibacterales bacterium]
MAGDRRRAQLLLPFLASLVRPTPPSEPRPRPVAPTVPAAPDATPHTADEIRFVRRRGTRRYILRVLDDGTLSVTVPWWGSKREARAFVASQQDWIAKQRSMRTMTAGARWSAGSPVLVDGEPRLLEVAADALRLDGVRVASATDAPRAVRAGVHRVLRARAVRELPAQLTALATRHGITVTRVSIRSQVSRWGSCSRQGSIALNWRLVQTPPWVREYVLLHELMHRRELNHSARFWRHVAAVCPRYVEARRWLRVEGAQLFD